MAQSKATKTKAPTLVGTSLENSTTVISLPERNQVVSLMEMVATLIKKHGRLSAMRVITSRNWLYLDANTTKDDDEMAVPGFGVALKDDDPRISKKPGRLITVSKETIERYTRITQNGKDYWQQRGQNVRILTPKVETKADAARLAKQEAKKAAASKATKPAGSAKKPAAPKAKGTQTSKKSAPKQKTVKVDGTLYTAEQYEALRSLANDTGNKKLAAACELGRVIAKTDLVLAREVVLRCAA